VVINTERRYVAQVRDNPLVWIIQMESKYFHFDNLEVSIESNTAQLFVHSNHCKQMKLGPTSNVDIGEWLWLNRDREVRH